MPELTTVTPPSPTMVGMPPEVLLNVFEWASRDDGLLDNMPSWRHYTLSNPDPNNPWYTPSMEAYNTIHAIAQVCSRWKTLASQFYLRHVVARTNSEVEAYLSQLKASADLRHWVKRLTLAIVVEDVQWTRRDTDRICKLMELCTDLEVFGNGIIALNGMCASYFKSHLDRPDGFHDTPWSKARRITQPLPSWPNCSQSVLRSGVSTGSQ